MKLMKIFALILAFMMVFTMMVACSGSKETDTGTDTDTDTSTDTSTDTGTDTDTDTDTDTSTDTGTEPRDTVATDDAGNKDFSDVKVPTEIRMNPIAKGYIRGGKYAGMNWRAINAQNGTDTNNEEPLELKGQGTEEKQRRVYFTFDIDALYEEEFSGVFFIPSFISAPNTDSFDVYRVNATWETDELTWNNAPKSTELIAEKQTISGLLKVDLTEAVMAAIAEGDTTFSFYLQIKDQESTSLYKINPKNSYLLATPDRKLSNFVYDLVGDPVENQKIWDRAEKLFDEWYARYLEIKDTPPAKVEKIVSDADEFNKIVYSSGTGYGNHTLSSVSSPYNTRTYDAMDDLGDYSDYDAEYPFDIYGGWMNPSMKQEATGFFYSIKLEDRWWIIDPLGFPCYIRAMHNPTMSYRNFSENQKNEALKLYGSEEMWRISVSSWLKDDLHFNLVDAQNGFDDVEDRMIYQTGAGSYMYNYAKKVGINSSTGGSTTISENNAMPVFDPGFETFCLEKARNLAAEANNPWILGYTSDNELPLDVDMLANYLKLDPTKQIDGSYVNLYSYATAWTFLRKMTGLDNPSGADITTELMELFRGMVWDRYFYVVKSAIRTYDPNHMYLGARFLTKVKDAEWVARFATLYLDCVTVNWYGQWIPDADDLYDFCSVVDLPLMVTEFYVKGLENDGSFDDPDTPLANTRGAGWVVRTQQDRGDFYQNFTLRLLECKYFVGWHWHMYIDNDSSPEAIYKNGVDGTDGWRDQSNIDANKGIVNNWHQPYEELCDSMAEINQNVYRLIEHFDAKYEK